eukprot:9803282-Alexandrium_andersonii.AAC.1
MKSQALPTALLVPLQFEAIPLSVLVLCLSVRPGTSHSDPQTVTPTASDSWHLVRSFLGRRHSKWG